MSKFTEHLVLPPGAEYRPPVPVKNDVEDLGPVGDLTREQQRRAAAVVVDRLGDGDEARTVLSALMQPVQATPPSSYERRTPESMRHRDYLKRVRRWAEEQGVPMTPAGYVSRAAQAAYDRAFPEEAR